MIQHTLDVLIHNERDHCFQSTENGTHLCGFSSMVTLAYSRRLMYP